ncbi:MAG: hypothetical protein ABJB66_19350 [Gemmatimonadaceae bacterium]
MRSIGTLKSLALSALASLALLSTPVASASAQLYGNDAAATKGGDLLDRDYWRAKWDSIRLDEAIKERQPEGAILMSVISANNLLDDLIKKFPADQDFKTWKEHTKSIEGRISSNANRGESFKPGSLWNERNYQETWVNYNYAKLGIEKKDWAAAKDGIRYANQNIQSLVARIKDNDRVAAWPDGAAKWVTDTQAELVKMQTVVDAKIK